MPAPLRVLGPAARLALVTLALAGCAKDLELPPLQTAPVVTSLTPARAWAGQLVGIAGARLDPDPAANVVSFSGATARGLRYDGSTLVVRVPDDAGSGPVIVTNGEGTSEPFGAFEYLGLGEPRRRAVATRRTILHRPSAVYAVGGDVVLHSRLFRGFLEAGNPAFGAGVTLDETSAVTAAAPWHGSIYATTFDRTTRIHRLLRLDATGAVAKEIVLPFPPTQLVAMRGLDVVVAFGDWDPGTGSVAALSAWSLDLATERIPPTAVGVDFFFGAADVGNGKAAVVQLDGTLGVLGLSLVDVQAALTGPLPAPVAVPGAPENLAFAGSFGLVGLAVAGTGTATPRAALTLDTGDLAVADLGLSPAFVGTVETFSTAAFEALAGAEGLPVVLATRPDDGLSIGVDLSTRSVVWSVPGDAPTAASAFADAAFVGHRATNDVSVVNLATGSRVARVTFDVAPGGSGTAYGGTTALLAADPALPATEDELLFPATRFPGLVRYPLGEGAASVVSRTAAIELVTAASTTVWAASDPGSVETFPQRAWDGPVAQPLDGPPIFLAARGSTLAVAHGPSAGEPGLQLLGGSAPLGSASIPGATTFHGLGFVPDGRIWVSLELADGEHVQLWDPSHLVSPGTPDVDGLIGRSTVKAAALLEDGLWVFAADSGGVALLLGPDLAVARTVPLAASIDAVHAVSPNGRLLVQRVVGGTPGETIVRFFRADPDAGFPQIDQIVVEGNVEGLAFDGTGERLWLVTRSPDGVVLVD